jgi:GMP synthase (glutamine-hydrolysing)
VVLLTISPHARVLVIEHEHDAGPEMLGRWLTACGVSIDICRPYLGDVLPASVDNGALMVLGGSMGACDDLEAPWLAQVRSLLAEATERGRAVLGICLGAQMLAAACGGRVEKSRNGGELGLGEIDLTNESRGDRLFSGMPATVPAAQWHVDEITEVPNGAVLLGSSPRCAVQAFRLGDRAWGVQFHPEASGALMRTWAHAEPPDRHRQLELAISEISDAEDRLFACWQGFAERFADIVKEG